jgi:4-amino-4-deoxy-L-arabinose transferase-like glycosyltransferase
MKPTPRLEYALLALIIIAYLFLGWRYAVETPDWQVPDEPAHYNYIRQIHEKGELPVIQKGDWDQDYQTLLTSTHFDPALTGDLYRIQYEDHQPPLYYLLQTPVYAATDGDLLAMRLFSVLIGAGTVVCAWAVGLLLFPVYPWVRLSMAAFVAFIPQRLSIMAGVSNDSLAGLMAGLVLVGVTVYLTRPHNKISLARPWLLVGIGLLVGLVFLTKTTAYYVAGVAGLAIVMRWAREGWPWQVALRQAAAFLVPALLIGSIWWIHGIDTYGGTDFLGLQRHDEVVVGQPRTDWYIDNVYGGSLSTYWENLAETTFHSFWGQMGWMAYPMPTNVYRALLAATLITIAGLLFYAWQTRFFRNFNSAQEETMALFDISLILVVAQFLIYNITFVQFQGRYLYTGLIPLSTIIALGLYGWVRPFSKKIPLLRWLPVLVTLSMALFAWYGLRDIIAAIPKWD